VEEEDARVTKLTEDNCMRLGLLLELLLMRSRLQIPRPLGRAHRLLCLCLGETHLRLFGARTHEGTHVRGRGWGGRALGACPRRHHHAREGRRRRAQTTRRGGRWRPFARRACERAAGAHVHDGGRTAPGLKRTPARHPQQWQDKAMAHSDDAKGGETAGGEGSGLGRRGARLLNLRLNGRLLCGRAGRHPRRIAFGRFALARSALSFLEPSLLSCPFGGRFCHP
jgi:hypothetical protein